MDRSGGPPAMVASTCPRIRPSSTEKPTCHRPVGCPCGCKDGTRQTGGRTVRPLKRCSAARSGGLPPLAKRATGYRCPKLRKLAWLLRPMIRESYIPMRMIPKAS